MLKVGDEGVFTLDIDVLFGFNPEAFSVVKNDLTHKG